MVNIIYFMTDKGTESKWGLSLRSLSLEQAIDNMKEEELLGFVGRFDEEQRKYLKRISAMVWLSAHHPSGDRSAGMLKTLSEMTIPDESELEEMGINRESYIKRFQNLFEIASMRPDVLEKLRAAIREFEESRN